MSPPEVGWKALTIRFSKSEIENLKKLQKGGKHDAKQLDETAWQVYGKMMLHRIQS